MRRAVRVLPGPRGTSKRRRPKPRRGAGSGNRTELDRGGGHAMVRCRRHIRLSAEGNREGITVRLAFRWILPCHVPAKLMASRHRCVGSRATPFPSVTPPVSFQRLLDCPPPPDPIRSGSRDAHLAVLAWFRNRFAVSTATLPEWWWNRAWSNSCLDASVSDRDPARAHRFDGISCARAVPRCCRRGRGAQWWRSSFLVGSTHPVMILIIGQWAHHVPPRAR